MRRPKPAINIINKDNLYLVDSDPLLRNKVSAANELDWGTIFWTFFFRDDENIIKHSYFYKLIEISIDRDESIISNFENNNNTRRDKGVTPAKNKGSNMEVFLKRSVES